MITDKLTMTSVLELENGSSFKLNYYIRTTVFGDEKIFALRVDQTEPKGGGLIKTESSLPLSDDYGGILRMAKAFADGRVTPGVLTEMCDEWEGQNLKYMNGL